MNQQSKPRPDIGSCQFGVVGLGAMGANFALNVAENGYPVIGLDPDRSSVERFCSEGTEFGVTGTTDQTEFVQSLSKPRIVFLLVPAGKTVDQLIEQLMPHLEVGDVLMDGGNSFFGDTERRFDMVSKSGIHFMGVGVSGGADGARRGASIMPGGSADAYQLVKPILEAVAAKVDGSPCVDLVGERSAGHYVKMVHNGIEYALMQLISECFNVLKEIGGLSNARLAETFDDWNSGELKSFLVEITSHIFRQQDEFSASALIDVIKDKAKQKGTGQWTSQNAFEMGIPVPTIHAAVVMRAISSFDAHRKMAHEMFKRSVEPINPKQPDEISRLVSDVHDALMFGYILSFDQGMRMIVSASKEYEFGINLESCARIWRGGCIIRADLLNEIRNAIVDNEKFESLMFSPAFASRLNGLHDACRRAVMAGIENRIPLPGFDRLPLLFRCSFSKKPSAESRSGSTGFLGMHSYERVDRPGTFRTNWPKL